MDVGVAPLRNFDDFFRRIEAGLFPIASAINYFDKFLVPHNQIPAPSSISVARGLNLLI